jgi:hypothetical protein
MDFMIEWTDKEVEASRIAKGMIENYFWKTSDKEALEINDLTELGHSFTFAHVRARVNDMLLLRYDSEFKWEEDIMAAHVEFTDLEELKKAKTTIMHRLGRT